MHKINLCKCGRKPREFEIDEDRNGFFGYEIRCICGRKVSSTWHCGSIKGENPPTRQKCIECWNKKNNSYLKALEKN